MTDADLPPRDRRWPRSVFAVGREPDARFTFANERTFLAWVRTALAFVAGGVALTAYAQLTGRPSAAALVGSLLLIACGVVSAVGSFVTWMRYERALRLGRPLPSSKLIPALTAVLVVFAVIATLLAL